MLEKTTTVSTNSVVFLKHIDDAFSSDWKKIHAELTFLKKIFRKNGYPENFIDKCFKNLLDNIHLVKEKVTTVEKKTFAASLAVLKSNIFEN